MSCRTQIDDSAHLFQQSTLEIARPALAAYEAKTGVKFAVKTVELAGNDVQTVLTQWLKKHEKSAEPDCVVLSILKRPNYSKVWVGKKFFPSDVLTEANIQNVTKILTKYASSGRRNSEDEALLAIVNSLDVAADQNLQKPKTSLKWEMHDGVTLTAKKLAGMWVGGLTAVLVVSLVWIAVRHFRFVPSFFFGKVRHLFKYE